MAQPVTQFDKDDLESIGLVKFDFPGLRTLTVIDWTLSRVNQRKRDRDSPQIDLAALPIDDLSTYEFIRSGRTTAIFQLESRGMRELIERMKPENFDELIALVALFRPGPLQSGMVDDYIDRKHGRKKVNYPHELVEQILLPTYGVILYQEQVMQIAQVLAVIRLALRISCAVLWVKRNRRKWNDSGLFLWRAPKKEGSKRVLQIQFSI